MRQWKWGGTSDFFSTTIWCRYMHQKLTRIKTSPQSRPFAMLLGSYSTSASYRKDGTSPDPILIVPSWTASMKALKVCQSLNRHCQTYRNLLRVLIKFFQRSHWAEGTCRLWMIESSVYLWTIWIEWWVERKCIEVLPRMYCIPRVQTL